MIRTPDGQKAFDVIVIGAGSIGVPTAFYLGMQGLRVLVLDSQASVGQGSNKKAIGGIRATHSDQAKIQLCKRSLEIFSTWKETTGDDIEWIQGGYCYPAYREQEEAVLKELVSFHQQHNLEVEWLDRQSLLGLVPDFNPDGLLGGSYSPSDGNASPLLAIHSFYTHAMKYGVEFRFNERVIEFLVEHDKVKGIRTVSGKYLAPCVITAAGAWANPLAKLYGETLPVTPDSHESAVTEGVAPFLKSMIVDIRPSPGSANYYFYQHSTGQIIFCITPSPSIWGENVQETSDFLPMVARRMVELMPRLMNIRVRRTWRGLYPMTPDGFPLLGWSSQLEGIYVAAGMCGQGFMLGPAVGELIARVITGSVTDQDNSILQTLHPYRSFEKLEKLK